jgi:hypothetical protein
MSRSRKCIGIDYKLSSAEALRCLVRIGAFLQCATGNGIYSKIEKSNLYQNCKTKALCKLIYKQDRTSVEASEFRSNQWSYPTFPSTNAMENFTKAFHCLFFYNELVIYNSRRMDYTVCVPANMVIDNNYYSCYIDSRVFGVQNRVNFGIFTCLVLHWFDRLDRIVFGYCTLTIFFQSTLFHNLFVLKAIVSVNQYL